MKKAKIFLTALTVLAVVGGSLAFKAKTKRIFAERCDNILPVPRCNQDTFTSFATTTDIGFTAAFDQVNAICKYDAVNQSYYCSTFTSPFQ